MKKLRSIGLFSVSALVLIAIAYGASVTAVKPTVGERFETLYVTSEVPKEEQIGEYGFDKAHSSIGFKIKHMGLVDVPGQFRKFDGKIDFDAKKVKNSTVEFSAEMTSVDTGINARDNHLRSKDFFEVKTYPKMTFKSTKVKKKGKRYIVTGDLTMKDVTKSVSFPVRIYGPIKDGRGNVRMGIVGSTVINRREFNVTYGGNLPNGTPTLANNVVVDLQIETVKKKEEKAK